MDNLENYLYLAFAVIYIISRILKARGKQDPQQERPQNPSNNPQHPPQRKKAFSFEDIIKEFEKSLGQEEEEPFPIPAKEVKYKKPTPVPVVEPTIKSNKYEKFEGTNFRQKSPVTSKKEDAIFNRAEGYSITDSSASDYVNELQTPEDFKKAFVLSEIINRKYF